MVSYRKLDYPFTPWDMADIAWVTWDEGYKIEIGNHLRMVSMLSFITLGTVKIHFRRQIHET
jgi:hypothetical protein